ncbi:hypothetical protein mRhiFer1_009363 [Rhinolophus ferrumequinum]|uniref:Uncharacterized protein n=2 Tax=Rhinolophus ferrumequinum TaxID=59479 RepID=A0A7J7RPJ1_RHIFE|nr:hypothetical protein mRhiFer1_009363 [Rhinolophus ferrumequinum]
MLDGADCVLGRPRQRLGSAECRSSPSHPRPGVRSLGKDVWEERWREPVILRQGLQTSAKGVSENFNSSIPNKRLGSGPLGDGGQSLAPQRVFSRALSAPCAPSHWFNRARSARFEFTGDSRGPAGRRADRQTPRCRAVSGCA